MSVRLVSPSRVLFPAIAALLGLLVLLANALASSPAEAGTGWQGIKYAYRIMFMSCGPLASTPDGVSVRGCYQNDPDQFNVADFAGNSMRVGLEWKRGRNGGTWGMCVNKLGAPKEGECDYDFPEGQKLIYRVGECDGTVHTCGKPGTGAGWTNWGAWEEDVT